MKKFIEKAQDYFERHPSSDECHVTSDGRVFHTLGSAQSMAGTLDDQTIESYKRKVLEKELADTGKSSTQTNEAEKETKLKELSELELVSGNYQQMKALASFFGLKPADQKVDTLIASLTEFKTTLNK